MLRQNNCEASQDELCCKPGLAVWNVFVAWFSVFKGITIELMLCATPQVPVLHPGQAQQGSAAVCRAA